MGLSENLVPATAEEQTAFAAASGKSGDAVRASVLLACAADVQPVPITWLWPAWLPGGKLTLLAGAPGAGKTTLALSIAAIVSQGAVWPDGVRSDSAGNVLIWSSEDDPADTLVPRLMAAGADLKRVHFIQAVADENGELQPFDPSRDMPLLSERLHDMGGAELLIVDPIVSAVSGDAHRVNDVRRNLQGLVDLAGAYRCAVLGISHFAKGSRGSNPAERVIGSQAFVALARMVLVAGKDEAAERRILARAKSNIAPDEGGLSYSIEQVTLDDGLEASRVIWGEVVEGSAREILGDVEQADDDERTLKDEAKDFLAGLLEDGPVSAKDLKRDADGAGFTWKTLQRAASDMGVEKRKLGMKEGWVWALPKETGTEEYPKNPAPCTVSSSTIVVPFGSYTHPKGTTSAEESEGDSGKANGTFGILRGDHPVPNAPPTEGDDARGTEGEL